LQARRPTQPFDRSALEQQCREAIGRGRRSRVLIRGQSPAAEDVEPAPWPWSRDESSTVRRRARVRCSPLASRCARAAVDTRAAYRPIEEW
jgi:hypothetical protein